MGMASLRAGAERRHERAKLASEQWAWRLCVPERSEGMSETQGALETVIITGLSGAGRGTAAKCFEDLGFFVVDNLPPALIGTLVDLGSRSDGAVTRLAVVMDVRS